MWRELHLGLGDTIRKLSVRKLPRSNGAHAITKGNFRAVIAQSGGPSAPVTISYQELILGQASRIGWRSTPENTAVIVLREGTEAPTLTEGKALANQILAGLASGELIGDRAPYTPPAKPERILDLDHPTLPLKAIILRWPEEYEVRTIGYVRDGFTLPVSSPSVSADRDYDWGRLDLLERILTDSEEEAITAAREELDRLAVADIPFKAPTESVSVQSETES